MPQVRLQKILTMLITQSENCHFVRRNKRHLAFCQPKRLLAYSIGITVSMGAFNILHATIAGLPASIVTDKFQGIIMGLLVVILTIAVPSQEDNRISREEFALASN